MTQHIKVALNETLLALVMLKLDKWPKEWGEYVVARHSGGERVLIFSNDKPGAVSAIGNYSGAAMASLDRLPTDYMDAVVTRDTWASSSGAKIRHGSKTLLESLLAMPTWDDGCGEFACWDTHSGAAGCIVFCDSRPADPKRGNLQQQRGAWFPGERPSDWETAVVTRSQWILAQGGDAWAASQAAKYPAYWREIPKGWRFIDTYRINQLFPVEDSSGAVLHARKKLLVPGVRTGGKALEKDLREAASTLECFLNN